MQTAGIILSVIGLIGVSMALAAVIKKPSSVYKNKPEERNPMEGKRVRFVENKNEKANADGVRGHLEATGEAEHKAGTYEKYIKRFLDVLLSFSGLVILSPLYLILSLWILIDDPGPVLFTQKRIGRNKQYFKLHKFRSMKMSTPHNVPTHMLENPEQYITGAGRFMRRHSLDELPQIWDIFIGNMSVIGPRPALWNQDVLTSERDKWGANDIKPGLTGWAQIHGRDELEIPVKAKLDGEYAHKQGLKMDVRCFFGSLGVFAHDDSVVEGGSGERQRKEIENKEPLVSIITPAYNAACFLEETVKSVRNQTYQNWEMIIVDDCSSDDTYKQALKFAEEDPRIKVIQNVANSGVAESRNNALDAASGDYIAFLDSDDMWVSTKLEKQIDFMQRGNYALTYTAYRILDTTLQTDGRIVKVPRQMNVKDVYGNTAIACLTVVVNRKMTGNFHMPLLNHAEDQCTWQELMKRGYTAYGIQEPLAYYRVGNPSLSFNKKKAIREQWNVYRRFHNFSVIKSMYYFISYAFNAVKKRF